MLVTLTDRAAIEAAVEGALAGEPVVDLHTHLYPSTFGTPHGGATGEADPRGLMLWGLDELLTYHYLVAELFRVADPTRLTPAQFDKMSKAEQANLIWRELFLNRSPISEACRGVLTTLNALGLDLSIHDLDDHRAFFDQLDPNDHIDRVMQLANVRSITMTNDVFDDNERNRWLAIDGIGDDPRFRAVLRTDPLLCDWAVAARKLAEWGYKVDANFGGDSVAEVRRFLDEWIDRTGSIYLAMSLPPTWRYPAQGPGAKVLREAILPTLAERRMPLALMIGVERAVNPALGVAGDMGFKADVRSVAQLCADFPDNKFLVTMLSLENQHELAVAGRKFGNLLPFGCWWFLNNPSLIEHITRMRMELLGTSFVPQHSDCRVLEQLIYKWEHTRTILTKVLTDKYADIVATGWPLTADDVHRDVRGYLSENFEKFLVR